MSQHDIRVKDMDAYTEGYNKGAVLIATHKKLTSVQASFLKSLMDKNYSESFYIGVKDGWDDGFRRQKRKLQEQHHEKEAAAPKQTAPTAPAPTPELSQEEKRQQRVQQMRQMTHEQERDQPGPDR
ncbi:MAG: hypothetical protein AAFO02_22980 [Bacteroidota bacterium]